MTIRYYGQLAHSDGPWELQGSPRIVHPFPDRNVNANLIIVERDYAGKLDVDYPLELDVKDEDFTDAFLVEQIETRRKALKYIRRIFAQVPADHVEYSSTNYKYPDYRETFFDVDDRLLRTGPTRTTPLRISYKYYHTTTPESVIDLSEAFQPMSSTYERDYVGDDTTPTRDAYKQMVSDGDWIRCEDDIFERWRGNIWRRVRKEVLAR